MKYKLIDIKYDIKAFKAVEKHFLFFNRQGLHCNDNLVSKNADSSYFTIENKQLIYRSDEGTIVGEITNIPKEEICIIQFETEYEIPSKENFANILYTHSHQPDIIKAFVEKVANSPYYFTKEEINDMNFSLSDKNRIRKIDEGYRIKIIPVEMGSEDLYDTPWKRWVGRAKTGSVTLRNTKNMTSHVTKWSARRVARLFFIP